MRPRPRTPRPRDGIPLPGRQDRLAHAPIDRLRDLPVRVAQQLRGVVQIRLAGRFGADVPELEAQDALGQRLVTLFRQGVGRVRAAVGGATNAASIGLWGRGASVLDRLSGAWRRAGSAARVAGRGFGPAFRLLGSGVRGVFSILRFSPFGLVLTMMDTALTMIQERWDSFRWFWDEIKAAATDFRGTMEGIGEAIGYNWARTKVSDKIEEWMNRWQGVVPERADAPVLTKRDLENMVPPPPPPDLQALSQRARMINDHSTTTVNVTQQPDEDSRAFAQRVAEEIRRARAARLRGAIYDPVGAF